MPMNFHDYFTELLPKTINYRLARQQFIKAARPITLTFSVTGMCQSMCKTCNIGARYLANPQIAKEDLTLDEIEKIFQSLGHIYFLNISGGEPFLRSDLPEVVELACKYLTPGIVHIPTNALIPQHIARATRRILTIMDEKNTSAPLTIKPSIDGVGELHDYIRGVKGNFQKLEQTIQLLQKIQQENPRLHVELGTVVSNFNIDHLDEIENYVHSLGVESYRNEIAEQREEFFNIGDEITPTANVYEQLMRRFSDKIQANISRKRRLAQTTEALRLVYYDLVVKILRKKTQVIPCYAGISNVHLNYNGGLWPCCVLGYKKPMGNLREANYDFQRVFHSEQANQVRRYIQDRKCYCPLANQAYSNILCNLASLLKVGKNILINNKSYNNESIYQTISFRFKKKS